MKLFCAKQELGVRVRVLFFFQYNKFSNLSAQVAEGNVFRTLQGNVANEIFNI